MRKYIHTFAGMSYLIAPLFLYWTRSDGVFEQLWTEKPFAMILLGLLGCLFVGLFHLIFIVLSHIDDTVGEKRE